MHLGSCFFHCPRVPVLESRAAKDEVTRVQLKKRIIGRSLLAILAIAIALPSMAHNRVPSITFAPSIDRYEVDERQQDARELVVIDQATLRHFDDVLHIEMPAEPIASHLETRIRSITLAANHASIDVFSVRQKLASGVSRDVRGEQPQ